jgi:5-methyltetrahydrofolate--homocysteine methyltransferase
MKVLIANQHEVTQLLPMSECIEVISDALTVSADHRQARITLDAIELIRKELGVNMNLGASNVSFGLPDRKIINVAYLALAISRGLTTAITDPTVPEIQTTLLGCDLLMGRDEYSARWIKAFRAREKAKAEAAQ